MRCRCDSVVVVESCSYLVPQSVGHSSLMAVETFVQLAGPIVLFHISSLLSFNALNISGR